MVYMASIFTEITVHSLLLLFTSLLKYGVGGETDVVVWWKSELRLRNT